MTVQSIGGLFFRAHDPDGLTAWYRDTLGVGAGCNADATGPVDEWSWTTAGGPVVFAPFSETSDYFPADKAYMLNLRVTDLDALVEKLARAGVEAIRKPEWDDPSTGRFARIHDPEGNPIELWELPQPSN